MSSRFQTPAQRKLAALQQVNQRWKRQQQAALQPREDEDMDEDEDEEEKNVEVLGSSHVKKAKTAHPEGSVSDSTAGSDQQLVLTDDATVDEQSMLQSYFNFSSFGARATTKPDIEAINAAHRRKEIIGARTAAAPPASTTTTSTPSEPKVKIEGVKQEDEEEEEKKTQQQQQPAVPRPPPKQPRKVAVPVAPKQLLGLGDYASSSEDEDAEQGAGSHAAAASSSTAAAASSAAAAAMSTDDEAESEDDDDAGGDGTTHGPHPLLSSLPISHEAEMKTNGHTKTVSALALDRTGSRAISGGYDYQVKLWNFSGMNEDMAAFRSMEPQEGHSVRSLQFSLSGDMFLCVTGGAQQPKLYTRDGVEVSQLAKGDMYLLDQKLTKGHSTAVTSGWWHPSDRNQLLTSGIDGTVRLWDVSDPSRNVGVFKPKSLSRGVAISATAWSKDGKIVAAASTDGCIRLLRCHNGFDYRDDKVVVGAHKKGSDTTALLFSGDGWTLLSRGGDGDHTLKYWDIRAFKQPVHIIADLENAYPETDMAFSPDEKIIVTGTSSRESSSDTEHGCAVFIDRSTMNPFQKVSLGCKSIIRSLWHPVLNQLFFGGSDGAIRVLYDPLKSTKGALLCVGRRAKPKPSGDFLLQHVHPGAIITPHALPSMRTGGASLAMAAATAGASVGVGGSRKRARERASEAMAPEAPLTGKVGVGGRAPGQQSITAYHLSKIVAMRHDPREKDPREALLAMEEKARADPLFTGAWSRTQPQTIFAEVPEEEQQVVVTEAELNLRNKKEGQTVMQK